MAVVFLFNELKVMFFCVPVTKGAQFDWPRTLRSQVSTYNIDYHFLYVAVYSSGAFGLIVCRYDSGPIIGEY